MNKNFKFRSQANFSPQGLLQTETIRGQRGLKLGVGSCNSLEVKSREWEGGGRKAKVGSPSTAFGLVNHKAEQHKNYVIYNDPTFQTCKYQMGKTPTYNVILSFFSLRRQTIFYIPERPRIPMRPDFRFNF